MEYPLTFERCVAIGGHCYESSGYVITTLPAIYHRVCKHCGHVQEGRKQPTIDWRDDAHQPHVKHEEE